MKAEGILMFILGIGGTIAAFILGMKSLEAGAIVALMTTGIMALLGWAMSS